MSQIRIVKAGGKWTVRASGAVLGETTNALELQDGDRAPVIFFPREDVAMAFLEPSAQTTTHARLGKAHFFSIGAKNRTLENAVWTYETPTVEAEALAGHLAFDAGEYLQVEQI